jgi:hypothetical protein
MQQVTNHPCRDFVFLYEKLDGEIRLFVLGAGHGHFLNGAVKIILITNRLKEQVIRVQCMFSHQEPEVAGSPMPP